MKRIKAACICQTLHFMLKEDVAHSLAERMVQEEVAQYKRRMEHAVSSSKFWKKPCRRTAPL